MASTELMCKQPPYDGLRATNNMIRAFDIDTGEELWGDVLPEREPEIQMRRRWFLCRASHVVDPQEELGGTAFLSCGDRWLARREELNLFEQAVAALKI